MGFVTFEQLNKNEELQEIFKKEYGEDWKIDKEDSLK